jgi:adenine-specific DNA methylase
MIKAAHPEETPLVVDPFAGGGSIPLEALRIGCDAFASDLNPVACLILKVMLEDIPKSGPELIDELKAAGDRIIKQAKEELKHYYPDDPDGSKPVAYIWARTVRCESPDCGAEIPLMRSFWLCNKAKKKVALKPIVKRMDGDAPSVDFEIFEPKKESEVHGPTVARAKATCLCCGSVLPPDRVRSQLASQNGGADVIFDQNGIRIGGARMLAVVLTREGTIGRHYRIRTETDYQPIFHAKHGVEAVIAEWEKSGKHGLCPFPNEPTPVGGGSGAGRAFSVRKYGLDTYADLFSNRQKLAHVTMIKAIREYTNPVVSVLLSIIQSKLTERNSSLTSWISSTEAPRGTFARQALSIIWDFLEISYASENSDFAQRLQDVLLVIEMLSKSNMLKGTTSQQNAEDLSLADESVDLVFTDPPYYDAIPYSDLSDFFLVWQKRTEATRITDPFDRYNTLSPKTQEIVQDNTRFCNSEIKDSFFFEKHIGLAFAEARRILSSEGICSIVLHIRLQRDGRPYLVGL